MVIKRLFLLALKAAIAAVAYPFIDLYTDFRRPRYRYIFKMIRNTYRYRFASIGIATDRNARRLLSYKNVHLNDRCFIIGNGPSLNLMNLSLLKNEYTFGVNAIYLNAEKMGFYPTYYVVEDTFVAEDRACEIDTYSHGTKFIGNYLRYCLAGSQNTVWTNVYFRYDNYLGFPRFSKNASRMVFTGGTVTYICMQLAYFMGFSEVYLIGFDHSYKIPTDAKIEGQKITSVSSDPNHFNKQYFGRGKRWHHPRLDRMETAYKKARLVFENSDRIIENASIGGRLEVFSRVSFDQLF